MFRRAIVALACAIKRDSGFDIDEKVSTAFILAFVLRRATMALRGLLVMPGCWRRAAPVFLGRRVVIRAKGSLMLSPGVTIEDNCRLDCLGSTGVMLGRGATLRRGVQIEVTSVLRELGAGCIIGDRVGLSEDVFIGAKGLIEIGSDTIIGPGVKIIAENHRFSSSNVPIREQGTSRRGIKIGTDCWLGANCVVLDGVSIGDHVVVGAGAIVTHDIPDWAIAAGVPARVLRQRDAGKIA